MATKSRGTAKGFLANYTVVNISIYIFNYIEEKKNIILISFKACGMKVVVSTNGLIDMTDWGSWECSWTILSDTIGKSIKNDRFLYR